MRKALTFWTVLGLLVAFLVIPVPMAAHGTGTPCAENGVTSAGIGLINFGNAQITTKQLEFCIQNQGVGDVNIVGAGGTGQYIKDLHDYTHALLPAETWENVTDALQTYGLGACVIAQNLSGQQYWRKITRIQLQKSWLGIWQTMWDSSNPPVHGSYYLNLSEHDSADRIIFDVASC